MIKFGLFLSLLLFSLNLSAQYFPVISDQYSHPEDSIGILSSMLSSADSLYMKDTTQEQSQGTVPSLKDDWYDKIRIRGYAQLRYNRLLETNPNLKCAQCDNSWGEGGGFFFRRIRLVFFGHVSERLYIYIQPDLASTQTRVRGGFHYAQVRDAYFDLALNDDKSFRLRFGQSKVPFGFENLQSSQNRIPLDRHDGINSAVANERDLGVFMYWAPKKIRQRFAKLITSGLKGSGDYGVFGAGIYNGQTANSPSNDGKVYGVTRITYPFKTAGGQYIEMSLQAYRGEFDITKSSEDVGGADFFTEQRAAASFIYYPQPFGFQMEYNIGEGPEFNPHTMSIENNTLRGGYAMAYYRYVKNGQVYIPFVRHHSYRGGKKHEVDATRHRVDEWEIGVEWQPFINFELVASYTISNRRFENFQMPHNRQFGNLLRLQAQFNF